MKIPCGSVYAEFKYGNQGTLVVKGLATNIPGGIIVDGGTWTLSNVDQAGWPVEWDRDIAPGDVIGVLTSTGYQSIEVTTVTPGATQTVIVGTQNPVGYPGVVGFLDGNQVTGVWKITPATLPCPPAPLPPRDGDEQSQPLPPPVQQSDEHAYA